MKTFTAKVSRQIVSFLGAAVVLSGGFSYAPMAQALENRYGTVLGEHVTNIASDLEIINATEARYVILITENVSDLSIVPSGGSTVRADDEDTFTDEFIFAPMDESQMIGVFLTTESYKIRFEGASSKVNISLYSGVGELFTDEEPTLDASLHYYDFNLPSNDKAQIEVSEGAVNKMKVDSDSNGSYENAPTPSYSRLNSTVIDMEPPVLSYEQSGNGLNVTATEMTGVKNIYYSTAERSGRLVGNAKKYSGTLSLSNFSIGDMVYFMAEDTVGNRGFWEPYMIIETEPTPALTPTYVPMPTPTPTQGVTMNPYLNGNINCNGTVYYVNMRGQKEGYPSAEIFLLWNTSFSEVVVLDPGTCSTFPDGGLTRLPANTLVKVDGEKTVWKIDGNVAYPIASQEALLRISSNPRIIRVSMEYLHTYSGGGAIY